MTSLAQLTEASAHATTGPQPADYASHLSAPRIAAWHKVISNLFNGEHLEDQLLGPVLEKLADEEARTYLRTHCADELKHADWLASYMMQTFGLQAKVKSPITKWWFDKALPGLSARFQKSPVLAFALLHHYELLSLSVYRELRRIAPRDGLHHLVPLISAIEKDERRHVVGARTLIRQYAAQGLSVADRALLASLLGFVLFDVVMKPWALHNRKAIRHLNELGIDPQLFLTESWSAARETWALLG